jgi:hypothetical protein
MYEQYTDKQIVEMLLPTLKELGYSNDITNINIYPFTYKTITTIYRLAYSRGQLGQSFIIGEKKNKEPVSSFKTGDKVKFLGLSEDEALVGSQFYPPVNTVGEVVEVLSPEFCFVQWPKCAIYSNGALSCPNRFLEKVTEHWVPATKDNVKRWNKVRYLNAEKHEQNPDVYPLQGTIGEVISVVDDNTYLVQWPDYTTAWFANQSDLEVLLRE